MNTRSKPLWVVLAAFVALLAVASCAPPPPPNEPLPRGPANVALPHEPPHNQLDEKSEQNPSPTIAELEIHLGGSATEPPSQRLVPRPPSTPTLRPASWNMHNWYSTKSQRPTAIVPNTPMSSESFLFYLLEQNFIDIAALQEVYVANWTKTQGTTTETVITDGGFFIKDRGTWEVLKGDPIYTDVQTWDEGGWTHTNQRQEHCPIVVNTLRVRCTKLDNQGEWGIGGRRNVHWASCTTVQGGVPFFFGCAHLSYSASANGANLDNLGQALESMKNQPGISRKPPPAGAAAPAEFILGMDANAYFATRIDPITKKPVDTHGLNGGYWEGWATDWNANHVRPIVFEPITGPFQGNDPVTKIHKRGGQIRVAQRVANRTLDNLIWSTARLQYIGSTKQVIPVQDIQPNRKTAQEHDAFWQQYYQISDHLPIKADFTIN